MAKKELKTNVMRVLDSKKLAYNHYAYDNSTVNGVEVARLLGQDPDRVFKTLVTRGKSGGFFVVNPQSQPFAGIGIVLFPFDIRI